MNKDHEPDHSQPDRMETSHTMKATKYVEDKERGSPKEETLKNHKRNNKAMEEAQNKKTGTK